MADYLLTHPRQPPDEPVLLSRAMLEATAADYDRLTEGRLAEHVAASPSAEAPEPVHALPASVSARPPDRLRVLVVEDEEPLRLAVRKMLVKVGFRVLDAASGSEAIELLRAQAGEIELLLLDLTVPGATSQEVLAEAVRTRSDIKIILTSWIVVLGRSRIIDCIGKVLVIVIRWITGREISQVVGIHGIVSRNI
jgi:PleD family two-component response regulator